MDRFLLFDSGCMVCSTLAEDIEYQSAGWLRIRSLHDSEMRRLLGRSKPNWRWEPTLLEVNGDHVRISTTTALRLRLIAGLGLKRAWRIGRLAQQANVSIRLSPHEAGRRTFLKRASTAASVLFFTPALSRLKPNAKDNPIEELTPEEASQYLDAARRSSQLRQLQSSLERDYAGTFTVDTSQGKAARFGDDRSKVIVAFPIRGGAGFSTFSLEFNKDVDDTRDDIVSSP